MELLYTMLEFTSSLVCHVRIQVVVYHDRASALSQNRDWQPEQQNPVLQAVQISPYNSLFLGIAKTPFRSTNPTAKRFASNMMGASCPLETRSIFNRAVPKSDFKHLTCNRYVHLHRLCPPLLPYLHPIHQHPIPAPS